MLRFRYARLYLAIQFFDSRSLLPPPFTYLTILLYLVRWASRTRRQLDLKMSGKEVKAGGTILHHNQPIMDRK